MRLPFRLRHLVFGALSLAALAAVATTPQLLGRQMREGIGGLADARAIWLWLAATAFAGGLVSLSFAWRSALGSCGGETSRVDAASRYGAGSLAGALLPAKVNSAVRIVLFSRTIRGEGRLWTSGGIASAIGAAHAFWLAVLLAYAGASGVLPLWPLAALALAVAAAAGVAVVARSRQPRHKVAHALDAFRVLGRSPRATATLLGWTGLALLARVGGMTAIAMALGVEHPFAAALLVVPAVELAGLLPAHAGQHRRDGRCRRLRAPGARSARGDRARGGGRVQRGRGRDEHRLRRRRGPPARDTPAALGGPDRRRVRGRRDRRRVLADRARPARLGA